MEERRFDELTRVLGGATSRRQVLKGLLGGAAAALLGRTVRPSLAAAAPAGCNVRKCEEDALRQTFLYQSTTCNNLCHDRTMWLACFGCQINAERLYNKMLKDCKTGDGCLSLIGDVCCGDSCVNTSGDPNNCGACGNVCSPGNDCVDGQCQCGDNGTMCNNECVDTQIDSHHCGNCETQCKTCESCAGGVCGPVDCGSGKTCCNDQCVDDCPPGQTRDPETCQCLKCAGQPDGAVCGTNEVCCQQYCVSNRCPSNMRFDSDSCGCVCDPTSCPDGELQDPDTCACQDLCANKTCGECQTCDPTSGDCLQAANGTTCSDGEWICCNGTCSTPAGQACCPVGSESCGSSLCCDSGTACNEYGDNQFICCAGDVLPDGTCCQADEYPLQCSYPSGTVTYVCCGAAAHGYNECHCCQPDCCDNVTCSTGPIEG